MRSGRCSLLLLGRPSTSAKPHCCGSWRHALALCAAFAAPCSRQMSRGGRGRLESTLRSAEARRRATDDADGVRCVCVKRDRCSLSRAPAKCTACIRPPPARKAATQAPAIKQHTTTLMWEGAHAHSYSGRSGGLPRARARALRRISCSSTHMDKESFPSCAARLLPLLLPHARMVRGTTPLERRKCAARGGSAAAQRTVEACKKLCPSSALVRAVLSSSPSSRAPQKDAGPPEPRSGRGAARGSVIAQVRALRGRQRPRPRWGGSPPLAAFERSLPSPSSLWCLGHQAKGRCTVLIGARAATAC